MLHKRYYSDRATVIYLGPAKADEITVREVTLEPITRELGEMVDFTTVAWFTDDKEAERVARLLNAAADLVLSQRDHE